MKNKLKFNNNNNEGNMNSLSIHGWLLVDPIVEAPASFDLIRAQDDGARADSSDEDFDASAAADDDIVGSALVDESSASLAAAAISPGTPSRGGRTAQAQFPSAPSDMVFERLAPPRLVADVAVLRRLGVVSFTPAAVVASLAPSAVAFSAAFAAGAVESDESADESSRNLSAAEVASSASVRHFVSPSTAIELAVPIYAPAIKYFGSSAGVRSRLTRMGLMLLPARVSHCFDGMLRYTITPQVSRLLFRSQRGMINEWLAMPSWARRILGSALLHKLLLFDGAEARAAAVSISAQEIDESSSRSTPTLLVSHLAALRQKGLLAPAATKKVLARAISTIAADGVDGVKAALVVRVAHVVSLLPRALVHLARDVCMLVLAPRAGGEALRASLRFVVLCLVGGAESLRSDAPSQGPYCLFSGVLQWLAWRGACAWFTEIRKAAEGGAPWLNDTKDKSEEGDGGARRRRRVDGDSDDGNDADLYAALSTTAGRNCIARANKLQKLVALVITARASEPAAQRHGSAQPFFTWSARACESLDAADSSFATDAPSKWASREEEAAVQNLNFTISGTTMGLSAEWRAVRAPGGWRREAHLGSLAEWETARSHPLAAFSDGLLEAANSLMWHAWWLATARCEGRRPQKILGCANLRLRDLTAEASQKMNSSNANDFVIESLRIFYFLATLHSCNGARRSRLWAWHRMLRESVAIGAKGLSEDLVVAARADTFLLSLPRDNVPWVAQSMGGSTSVRPSSAHSENDDVSSVESELEAEAREALSASVPLICLRALRWPGPVVSVGISVQHATAPPLDPADERSDSIPAVRRGDGSAAEASRSSSAHSITLSRGRSRAWHIGADGFPATVERIVCEALVACPALRAAVMSPPTSPRVTLILQRDGRGSVTGENKKMSLSPVAEWPPGLSRGPAAASATKLVDQGAGLAVGDPFALADAFPALATPGVTWCARPEGVLKRGDIMWKDAGGGGGSAAAASVCGTWRAAHLENAIWSQLFAALLCDVICYTDSGENLLERAWKHPWQEAPLDMDHGWGAVPMGDARRVSVYKKIDAIALMHRCELASHALSGARTIAGAAFFRARGDGVTPEELACISHAAGGQLVAFIMRRLAADPVVHAAGLPDVVLWRVPNRSCIIFGGAHASGASTIRCDNDSEPGFALVEVKAEGDRVQPTQLRWFAAWAREFKSLPISILRVTCDPAGQRPS